MFEDTVIDIVSKRVFYEIPEKFKWALWQNIHYVSTDQIDDDNDEIERLRKICVHEDIAREIFQRLCPIAENAYYEVEEDED